MPYPGPCEIAASLGGRPSRPLQLVSVELEVARETDPGRPPALDSGIDAATEVIGNRDEAMRWVGIPVRALDFATPIARPGTREGTAHVEDMLGQMAHGVW